MKTSTLISLMTYFTAGIAAFFFPIIYAFCIVAILVVIDTITGIMKAGRNTVKDVKSKKAFAFVPKLIWYCLLVILAHSLHYIEPSVPFVKLALMGVAWIEVKSIDENFEVIFGFSFINKVLEAVKGLSKFKRK